MSKVSLPAKTVRRHHAKGGEGVSDKVGTCDSKLLPPTKKMRDADARHFPEVPASRDF